MDDGKFRVQRLYQLVQRWLYGSGQGRRVSVRRSGVGGKLLLKTKFPLIIARASRALDILSLLPDNYVAPVHIPQQDSWFNVKGRVTCTSGAPSAAKAGLPRQVVRLMHGEFEFDVEFIGQDATKVRPMGSSVAVFALKNREWEGATSIQTSRLSFWLAVPEASVPKAEPDTPPRKVLRRSSVETVSVDSLLQGSDAEVGGEGGGWVAFCVRLVGTPGGGGRGRKRRANHCRGLRAAHLSRGRQRRLASHARGSDRLPAQRIAMDIRNGCMGVEVRPPGGAVVGV